MKSNDELPFLWENLISCTEKGNVHCLSHTRTLTSAQFCDTRMSPSTQQHSFRLFQCFCIPQADYKPQQGIGGFWFSCSQQHSFPLSKRFQQDGGTARSFHPNTRTGKPFTAHIPIAYVDQNNLVSSKQMFSSSKSHGQPDKASCFHAW